MLISSGRVAARERFSLSGATARLQKPLRHSVSLSKALRPFALGSLAAVLVGFASSANAAYVQRYVNTARGGLTFTGNTLGLGRGSATAPGTQDSIGAFTTINTALQQGTYPAGTTADWHLNSSS